MLTAVPPFQSQKSKFWHSTGSNKHSKNCSHCYLCHTTYLCSCLTICSCRSLSILIHFSMQTDLHAENVWNRIFQSATALAFPSWSRRSTTTLYHAEKQTLFSWKKNTDFYFYWLLNTSKVGLSSRLLKMHKCNFYRQVPIPLGRWSGPPLNTQFFPLQSPHPVQHLDWLSHFYRAMLCIRGTSHGPVSVRLSVRHKSVFY